MGSTEGLNGKSKDAPVAINKTLVFVAVCFLIVVTGLVSLILFIFMSNGKHPEVKGLNQERNLILRRKNNAHDQKEIDRAMMSNNWISETANRKHFLYHNPSVAKKPGDQRSLPVASAVTEEVLQKISETTQVSLKISKGHESYTRKPKFLKRPLKPDSKQQIKPQTAQSKNNPPLEHPSKTVIKPKESDRYLVKGVKISPKIHKGQIYDFVTEEGLDEAEIKMAKRMKRQASEMSDPDNKIGPCVDKAFGFYPDYSLSCKVFYLCLRGRQRTFQCPQNKVFDRRSLDCVKETVEKQICRPSQMKCTDKAIHFYPDFRMKCTRFFMCLHGITHYYACPSDMVFSPNLLACVPNKIYNCSDPYLAVEIGRVKIEPLVESTTTTKPTRTILPGARPIFQSNSNFGQTELENKDSSSQFQTSSIVAATNNNLKPNFLPFVASPEPATATIGPPKVIRVKTGSKIHNSRFPPAFNYPNLNKDTTFYHGFIYTKPIRVHNIPVAHTITKLKKPLETIITRVPEIINTTGAHTSKETISDIEESLEALQSNTSLVDEGFPSNSTELPVTTTRMQVLVIVRGKPCNGTTYRPDYSSNCRKFYWCVRGQERLYTCPLNKKFSSQLEKCTNPEEVTCKTVVAVKETEGRRRFHGSLNEGTWLTVATPRASSSSSNTRPRQNTSRWWPKFGDKIKNEGLVVRRTAKDE